MHSSMIRFQQHCPKSLVFHTRYLNPLDTFIVEIQIFMKNKLYQLSGVNKYYVHHWGQPYNTGHIRLVGYSYTGT